MYSDTLNTYIIKNKWTNGKNEINRQIPIIYSGL